MSQDRQGSNPVVKELILALSMTIKVPAFLLFTGFAFFAFLMLKAHSLHSLSPWISVINTVSVAACTALVSTSVFFSLFCYFKIPAGQTIFIYCCFAGSVVLMTLFLHNFSSYLYVNRFVDKMDVDITYRLPEIVQNVRNASSEDQREKWARGAYLFYGIQLSYRKENGEWVYFQPSQEEEAKFQNFNKISSSVKELRKSSLGLLAGAEDVVFVSFFTFLFGLLWLITKGDSMRKASVPSF